jgi:hypothetical protein
MGLDTDIMTTYKDLLGSFDFYQPLNGTDVYYTSPNYVVTKDTSSNSPNNAFATENVDTTGSTQCWRVNSDAFYHKLTGSGSLGQSTYNQYIYDSYTMEFWIKVGSANKDNVNLFFGNVDPYGDSPLNIQISPTNNPAYFNFGSFYYSAKNITTNNTDTSFPTTLLNEARIPYDQWVMCTIVIAQGPAYQSGSTTLADGNIRLYLNGILHVEKWLNNYSRMDPQYKYRPPNLRMQNNDLGMQVAVAHIAVWHNQPQTQSQIVKRYRFGKTQLNYDSLVTAQNPVYWNKFNANPDTPIVNTLGLTTSWGSGVEVVPESRGKVLKQTDTWTGPDNHSILLGNLSNLQSLIATGNWTAEMWIKSDNMAEYPTQNPNVTQCFIGQDNLTGSNASALIFREFNVTDSSGLVHYTVPDFIVKYGDTRYTSTTSTVFNDIYFHAVNNIDNYIFQDLVWKHLAWTSEWNSVTGNGAIKTYQNGKLVSTLNFNKASLANSNPYTTFRVLRATTEPGYRRIHMSDLVFYNTTLTESDFTQRYYAENQGLSLWQGASNNAWYVGNKELVYDGTNWVNVQTKNPQYWDGTQWVQV